MANSWNINTDQSNIINRARDFITPQGLLENRKYASTYTPRLTATQQQANDTQDSRFASTLSSLPTSYGADSSFNQGFYDKTKGLLTGAIDQRKARDTQELDSQLNAMNQGGSSYDALRRKYLSEDYNKQYADAENQATLTGFDASQQGIKNNLLGAQVLSDTRAQSLQDMYYPLTFGMQDAQIASGKALAQADAVGSNYNQKKARDNALMSSLISTGGGLLSQYLNPGK
jgi:hypothetical protein